MYQFPATAYLYFRDRVESYTVDLDSDPRDRWSQLVKLKKKEVSTYPQSPSDSVLPVDSCCGDKEIGWHNCTSMYVRFPQNDSDFNSVSHRYILISKPKKQERDLNLFYA